MRRILIAMVAIMAAGTAFGQHSVLDTTELHARTNVPWAQTSQLQKINPCALYVPIDPATASTTRIDLYAYSQEEGNGCSLAVRRKTDPDAAEFPSNIIGLTVRLQVINAPFDPSAPSDGVVVAGDSTIPYGFLAYWFGYPGAGLVQTFDGMIATPNGQFDLRLADGNVPSVRAYVEVDITGYFTPDPQATGLQGPKGEKGDVGTSGTPGKDGSPCVVSGPVDGVWTMTCPGGSTATWRSGTDGLPGASCTVASIGGNPPGYTMTCGTTSVTWHDGAAGANGSGGAQFGEVSCDSGGSGSSCTVPLGQQFTSGICFYNTTGASSETCSFNAGNPASVTFHKPGTVDWIAQ
jgi:hypothetical protein